MDSRDLQRYKKKSPIIETFLRGVRSIVVRAEQHAIKLNSTVVTLYKEVRSTKVVS